MTDDSRRKYTRRELMNLWGSGFAGDEDEIEKLSGFADCDTTIAAEMITSFRKTAAAQKATEAEANRMKKPPRKKKDPAPVEDGEVEISEPFPATDLIAAAVNAAHGFSVVIAEALSRDRKRSVLVERVSYHGERYYRLKTTCYSHFKSKEQAIAAAKQHRLKLKVYGNEEKS